MGDIWSFLQDETNRTVLAWLGGGAAVVVGGLWAAWLALRTKPAADKPAAPSSVRANGGGVAVGRDVTNSTITTGKK